MTHNSSSTLSITFYPFINCSKTDSLFLENIVYKLVNKENIRDIRNLFNGAQSIIIDPKLFNANDHKYLALGMLRRVHLKILEGIQKQDALFSFLNEANVPLSTLQSSTFCLKCNLDCNNAEFKLTCEHCKLNLHLQCIKSNPSVEDYYLVKEDYLCDNCLNLGEMNFQNYDKYHIKEFVKKYQIKNHESMKILNNDLYDFYVKFCQLNNYRSIISTISSFGRELSNLKLRSTFIRSGVNRDKSFYFVQIDNSINKLKVIFYIK